MAKRVLIAAVRHETNTFSQVPTDVAAFRARELYRGEEIPRNLTGTKTEIAAYLDAAERFGWIPVCPVSANATPSGKVTRAAFDEFTADIIAAIDGNPPFDAILLALHGAMVVEHHEDGEGLLLRLIRDRVGRDVPIGVTLDLHANVTKTMAECADVMISYRTYPHVDQYERATETAELIRRAVEGEIRPTVTVSRGDILDGVDHGRTTAPGPMTEVQAMADAMVAGSSGILAISINAGFPWADIRDAGPTAVVVCDGKNASCRTFAGKLMDAVWESRHRLTVDTVTAADAVARAKKAGGAPLVLADFADNPGGGGYGDATALLGAMIDAGLDNAAFATIHDPEAAAICTNAGTGATVSLALGGKVDPRYGAPLDVTGTVEAVTDGTFVYEGPMLAGATLRMGPTAVLRVGGVDIVVTSSNHQALDRRFFSHAGIDPAAKSILAVKSAHHFRAAFGPIASQLVVVDSGGGLTSNDFRAFPFERLRRPIYPLDLD